MNMLSGDHLLQSLQFALQLSRPRISSLEQMHLKPAVEILNRPIVLRPVGRNEDGFDAKAQTKANDPREIAGGGSPAHEFASIVELNLGGPTQVLPTFAQELQNVVHFAGTAQSQANGTVEDIFAKRLLLSVAHIGVVALPVAFEVDGAYQIHLMQLIGVVGLGTWIAVLG